MQLLPICILMGIGRRIKYNLRKGVAVANDSSYIFHLHIFSRFIYPSASLSICQSVFILLFVYVSIIPIVYHSVCRSHLTFSTHISPLSVATQNLIIIVYFWDQRNNSHLEFYLMNVMLLPFDVISFWFNMGVNHFYDVIHVIK